MAARAAAWRALVWGDLQAVDAMERRWKMSVVVSVKRLQQLVRAISGVFLSCGKVLIDGADLQSNYAVVGSMEYLLLFSGSSGVNTVERQWKSRN